MCVRVLLVHTCTYNNHCLSSPNEITLYYCPYCVRSLLLHVLLTCEGCNCHGKFGPCQNWSPGSIFASKNHDGPQTNFCWPKFVLLQLTPSIPAPQLMTSSASSALDDMLEDPDEVIRKYLKLLNLANIGLLAVRLSCEAYFGKELLKKRNVYCSRKNTGDCNNKLTLPKKKGTFGTQMKSKFLLLYPQFISAPVEFEPIWCKCIGAINHCFQPTSLPVPMPFQLG